MSNEKTTTRFWVNPFGYVVREWTDEEYATHDPHVPIKLEGIPEDELRCLELRPMYDKLGRKYLDSTSY